MIAAGVGEPETYLIAERARHEFSHLGRSTDRREDDRELRGGDLPQARRDAEWALSQSRPGRIRRPSSSEETARRSTAPRSTRWSRLPLAEGAVARRRPGNPSSSLAEVVDAHHFGGRNHAHRVGRYAESIAREMRLEEPTVDRVRLAGNASRRRKSRHAAASILSVVTASWGLTRRPRWSATHWSAAGSFATRASTRSQAGSRHITSAPTGVDTRPA